MEEFSESVDAWQHWGRGRNADKVNWGQHGAIRLPTEVDKPGIWAQFNLQVTKTWLELNLSDLLILLNI